MANAFVDYRMPRVDGWTIAFEYDGRPGEK